MQGMTTSAPATPEIFFDGRGLSLCFIPNRRQRSMRVIDFRSGLHPTKATVVARVAREAGMERLITLVERDEVNTWTRLGFSREGTIPGYYKRSDAWVLGTTIDPLCPASADESGLRRAPTNGAASDATGGERAYQAARRDGRLQAPPPAPAVRMQSARDADVKRAVAAAGRARRALTGFEPFGRDVVQEHLACTARGGHSLLVGIERQLCFENAYLQLLVGPRTEKEWAFTVASLRLIGDELKRRDVTCCFAMSPIDDLPLAVAFLAAGYRKTGLLRGHFWRREARVDAFLWTRKLATPADG